MKTAEQDGARHLRAQGCSIKEIEQSLGVARSWVRDVELGKVVRCALAARVTEGRLSAALKKAAARAFRAAYQEEGRQRARIEGASYTAGCMLYRAEGEKSRWSVGISNSDVELLCLFAAFLRTQFNVPNEAMRVHCHLYADHMDRQQAIEQHWLAALGLPDACLRKTMLNVTSKYTKTKRSNKLPSGTCKLRVHSTRIVQTIYGSIQEYGGFERAEWLG